jgi:hypothetical protein
MKRLLLVIAALAVLAPAARAQSGVNLYVGDCSAGSTQAFVANTCASNTGTAMALVGSVMLPATTVTQFVGAVSTIDVLSAAATLPDWWHGDACRSSAFTATGDAFVSPSCPTLWDGHVAPLSAIGFVPAGSPNRIRIQIATAIPSEQAFDLVGGDGNEYGVFRLTVSKVKTTGDGACAGCVTGACLVLQEVNLQALGQDPNAVLRITNPLQNNFVFYNSGSPSCYTPTRNRTWGALKSLYR